MARRGGVAVENNFIAGLVTQATGLNFPENAATEATNVIFDQRGVVTRRPGFSYEGNAELDAFAFNEAAVVRYTWKNATGDGNLTFVVVQVGETLHFYNTGSSLSLSAGKSASTVDLTDFSPVGSPSPAINECQFADGLGYLFVVHPYLDPFYVEYDPVSGTFSAIAIDIRVRDLKGVDDGLTVDERPSTLSDLHKYNLVNQGWRQTQITGWDGARADFPSNADVWWIFKDSTGAVAFSTEVANTSRGTTPAPKGAIHVSPWDTDRSGNILAQTGITIAGLPDETSGYARPAVAGFHAGRVFYAGVSYKGYNSKIYFSQIIEDKTQFGLCHSRNDQTTEDLFDFLPTDGGVISIPDAGTIYRLVPFNNTLIVFAANGVYAISGSQGIGFTATDFSIGLVKNVRSISGSSFVVMEDGVLWWNANDINVLQSDPQKGLVIQSLSEPKIKDFYLDLPVEAKSFVHGAYNPRTKLVQWLYRSVASGTVTENYVFDSVLTLNLVSGAFYTWTPSSAAPVKLHGVVVVEGVGSVINASDVVDNLGDTVVDQNGDPVISFGFATSTINTVTKFFVSNDDEATFAEVYHPSYKDWPSVGDYDYDSAFTTGYKVRTEGQRRFQGNYIFVFTENDIPTAVDFQARWNFANSADTGKWTNTQRIEHDGTNYTYARRRLKVRGDGEAVQFRYSSVSGQPFQIVGWSTNETASANV